MIKNIKLNYRYTFLQYLVFTGLWMLYLSKKGFSPWEIGLMEAIFHCTSFLFEVPSGSIGDRFGYKRTLIISRIINIASCLLTVLAADFWLVTLGFVLSAVSYNLASGTNEALVFESLKAEKREQEYLTINTRIYMLIELSSSLGIVAAGLLSEYFFDGVYWLQIASSVLAIIVALYFKEPRRSQGEQQKYFALMSSAFRLTKGIAGLPLVMLTFALVEGLNATYYFYFQNYFAQLGITGMGISLVILLSSCFQIMAARLAPWLDSRFSMSHLFLGMFVLSTVAIGLSSNAPLFLVVACFILVNSLSAFVNPIRSNFINQLIPSEHRATINSIDSLCFSLVMIPFFPLIGAVVDRFGYQTAFVVIAAFLGVSGTISYQQLRKQF